ncbi:hypothetical protein [uncultured Flavonifractor sp.]|uniref:hypothetical protein n=1 Tax=uncultured Flavonifractor sp. TaxID=1193534 RepID=UPI00261D5B12|nr:hypothetical protein [uncultured Flavonifractor sp.]
MLERQLTLEGGTLYCDLGPLEPGGWQTLDCSLRLAGVLPERRVAVAVEVTEGDICRGARIFSVPAHHGSQAADVVLRGVRFYLPEAEAPRRLTVRADAHYLDLGQRCLL